MLQVRKVAEENGVDVSESIRELEERAKQVTYSFATCIQCNSYSVIIIFSSSSASVRCVLGSFGKIHTHG